MDQAKREPLSDREWGLLDSIECNLARDVRHEFVNRLRHSPRHDRDNVRVAIERLKALRKLMYEVVTQ